MDDISDDCLNATQRELCELWVILTRDTSTYLVRRPQAFDMYTNSSFYATGYFNGSIKKTWAF